MKSDGSLGTYALPQELGANVEFLSLFPPTAAVLFTSVSRLGSTLGLTLSHMFSWEQSTAEAVRKKQSVDSMLLFPSTSVFPAFPTSQPCDHHHLCSGGHMDQMRSKTRFPGIAKTAGLLAESSKITFCVFGVGVMKVDSCVCPKSFLLEMSFERVTWFHLSECRPIYLKILNNICVCVCMSHTHA